MRTFPTSGEVSEEDAGWHGRGVVHSITNFSWSFKHHSLLAILLSTLLNPFYPSAYKRATISSSNKNSQWLSIKFGFPLIHCRLSKAGLFSPNYLLAKLHNALATPARAGIGGLSFCKKSLSRRVVQGEVRKTHGKAEKQQRTKEITATTCDLLSLVLLQPYTESDPKPWTVVFEF